MMALALVFAYVVLAASYVDGFARYRRMKRRLDEQLRRDDPDRWMAEFDGNMRRAAERRERSR